MSEYQLELKQIVDYPRYRIDRQFIDLLIKRRCFALQASGLPYRCINDMFQIFDVLIEKDEVAITFEIDFSSKGHSA